MVYITVNKYGTITKVGGSSDYPVIENGDIFVELHSDVIQQIVILALKNTRRS